MSFLKIYSPEGLLRFFLFLFFCFCFATTILSFVFNTLCPVLMGEKDDTEPKP